MSVRVLLAFLTVPVAIAANAARVAGTGLAANWIGPEAAEGFFHAFSGWLVFVAAFGLLLLAQRVFSRTMPAPLADESAARHGGVMLTRAGAARRRDRRRRRLRFPRCRQRASGRRANRSASLPSRSAHGARRETCRLTTSRSRVLGVDDYVNRVYGRPSAPPVSLYIGYYASQRQGDTIHSPQNCLPGAGWQAVESGRTTLDLGGRSLVVNRYMIQKGLEPAGRPVLVSRTRPRGRQRVRKQALADDRRRAFASYQRIARQGRRSRRGRRPGGVQAADGAAADFARSLYPSLSTYLP